MVVALTVDIVGSRKLEDRELAQRALDAARARVDADLPLAIETLHPIVGDELQGVYPDLDAALRATLLLQLALPDGIECRFGLGVGPIGTISSSSGAISDGPGWWAAREAVTTVEQLARRRAPSARTWVVAADSEPQDVHALAGLANAYVLARDQLVAAMSERTRRLTYGRCLAQPQRALAEAEGVTQSAVSQALATSGANAVVQGFTLLRDLAGVTTPRAG